VEYATASWWTEETSASTSWKTSLALPLKSQCACYRICKTRSNGLLCRKHWWRNSLMVGWCRTLKK
jgi:hypothetical protein